MKRLAAIFLFAAAAPAAEFEAGLAAVPITPQGPVRMSGYAARTRPSEGAVHDLWAKALALQDAKGRFVIVTLDLVMVTPDMVSRVAAHLKEKYGLRRDRLLINCSHTHAGPVLRPNRLGIPEVEGPEARQVSEYTDWVVDAIARAAGQALGGLAPARLEVAHGTAGFATNRREHTAKGYKIGVNPEGPVDRDVPAIAILAPDGRLRGILFAYACHNTTLPASFYRLSGDYAGFAQLELEKRHPGAVALFMQLCGGDQNPQPRGTLELAAAHGRTLADAVDRALAAPRKPLHAPLRAALENTQLTFPPYPRERFAARDDGSDSFPARHARRMLAAIDAGKPIRAIPYPVQAVRFGRDLTLVALGGEVLVDYALRAKREFQGEDLIVAGYSNDVMCYIPSLRVLKEGGYEPDESLIYDGMPGPFDESVEERVFQAVRKSLRRVGWKLP